MWKRMKITGALLALALASPLQATGNAFTNMYVLGDSLSDQGNLYAATVYTTIPRGDYYDNGRFSNGPIYADFLSSELGVPLTSSLSGGNNYAFGGARTDYNTVEDKELKPEPFRYLDQAELFSERLFPWTLETQSTAFDDTIVDIDTGGLYVVFSGSNDLADIIEIVAICAGPLPPPLWCPSDLGFFIEWSFARVLQGVNSAIAAFVHAGAQEILVPNIPDLGLTPGFRVTPAAGLATDLSDAYNTELVKMLDAWKGFVNIIPLDTFSLLTEVVKDPETFGFENATEPCFTGFVGPSDDGDICDNPELYVFWDFQHPTTALHTVLAEIMLASFIPDMLEYLSYQVSELDSRKPFKNSLNGKLDGAADKFAAGRGADAAAKLEEFIQKIIDKQGKLITEADALSMILRAEKIIALLEA